nr:DNA cytosine methyltransferase [Streptococcus uberis]
MENVPNSRNSVKERYTFLDLDLEDWAKNNGINPEAIALHVKNNGDILHSDDYGAAQTRKRFVCGEITRTGLFPAPTKLNQQVKSLKMIFENFPKPLSKINQDYLIPDPNYPDELISTSDITDHYYDTGIYRVQWQRAKDLKLMHPYMGKMSFPENFDKPSRTIMATQSASTRESIIYPSEISRKGDGEFRLPTIREAATIMGYPLDYQFYGDESTKWRLVGNAVCVQLSYALALEILKKLKHSQLPPKYIDKNLKQFNFLDNHKEKVFNNPPKRSEKALFRHFPIKSGNMTVDLTNKINGQIGTWGIIAHSGTGKGFSSILIDSKHQEEVMNILLVILPEIIDIVRKDKLIKKYTNSYFNTMNRSYGFFGDIPDHPYMLIEHIRNIISELIKIHGDKEIDISGMRLAKLKSKIPFSQVISIYLLSILIFGEK